jgi:Rab GDP dissociation inhibitor
LKLIIRTLKSNPVLTFSDPSSISSHSTYRTNARFISVTDLYVPLNDGRDDHCYISKSYDATSHFETTTDDVKDIYQRITGKPLIIKQKLRPTQACPWAILD